MSYSETIRNMNTSGRKLCCRCHRLKSTDRFYNDYSRRDGKSKSCKICDRKRTSLYRALHGTKERGPKDKSRQVMRNAIRRGRVIRPKVCQECGKRRSIHAHHEDYKKPLNVEWLCSSCHGKKHRGRIIQPSGKKSRCRRCKAEFWKRNHLQLFCSTNCRNCYNQKKYRLARRKKVPCSVCGKSILTGKIRRYCSRKCKSVADNKLYWARHKSEFVWNRGRKRYDRREVRESIQKCGKCLQIVERLG